MIKFVEITNNNIADVISLSVHDNQKEFVADNAISLAEAYATRNEGNVALPYAVYDENQLIGFVMLGYGTVGDIEEPEIFMDNYILWRLMIDKKYQGNGYAKRILDEVAKVVKEKPCGDAEYLFVSYEKENLRGRTVYLKYGFEETDIMCGAEIVALFKI